jgi:hypothetical protein
LDGDYVDASWLAIPRECFKAVDLSKPFDEDEKFDLAVSLEVAEHLPKKHSREFVRSLVRLAPVILFSAAIPFQGGVRHINEQWPQFWQDIFSEHGYKALDLIRGQIWKNPDVRYWYRQNLCLFVREDLISSQPTFVEASMYADDLMLVHRAILHYQLGLLSILKNLPRSIWNASLRQLRRRFR